MQDCFLLSETKENLARQQQNKVQKLNLLFRWKIHPNTVKMDSDVENLIRVGNKQIYEIKNYEAGEKILLLALQLYPNQKTDYINFMLSECRNKQAETKTTSLRDHESGFMETELTGTVEESKPIKRCFESERKKTIKPIYNDQPSYENQQIKSNYCGDNGIKRQPEFQVKDTETKETLKNVEECALYKASDIREEALYERKYQEINKNRKTKEKQTEYQPDKYEADTNTNQKCENKDEKEAEMIRMCFQLRIKVLQIGIKTFSSKPDYRPDVNFDDVSIRINDLILRTRNSFHNKNMKDAEYYMSEAEKIYCRVAIVLPQASEEKLYERKYREINKNKETEEKQNEYQPDEYEVDTNTNQKCENKDEKEAEMIRMCFQLRIKVLQIGIKTFGSKPDYRPDVNFDDVSIRINDIILRTKNSLHINNVNDAEYHMYEAEKIYCRVAIVLPQTSFNKWTKYATRKYNINTDNISTKTMENFSVSPKTSTQSKSTSYKEFVKGDNIDVIKCLELAEKALLSKDFRKAERLINKSNRIFQTKNARKLFERLQLANLEEEQALKQAAEVEGARERAEFDATKQEADQAIKTKEGAAKQAIKTTEERAPRPVAKIIDSGLAADIKSAIQTVEEASDRNENILFEYADLHKKVKLPKAEKRIVDSFEAKKCFIKAEEYYNNKNFGKAEKLLLKAKRMDSDINTKELQSSIRNAVASRSTTIDNPPIKKENGDVLPIEPTSNKKKISRQYYNLAQYYMKKNDVKKAKQNLLQAKEYYNYNHFNQMFHDIEKNEKIVEETNQAILKSSKEDERGKWKKMSSQYYKRAEYYMKKNDVKKAKENLLIAKEYYNFNNFKQMFDDIEYHEKIFEGSNQSIPESSGVNSYAGTHFDYKPGQHVTSFNVFDHPSFVNSYSENPFSYYPGQEEIPSYHTSTDNAYSKKVEDCLKNGRMALTKGLFEKAKEYALKSEKSSPLRAQALLYDIDIKQKQGLSCGKPVVEDYNNDVDKFLAAAERELLQGNVPKAKEFLNKAELLQLTAQNKKWFDKIKNFFSQSQSEYAAVHHEKYDQSKCAAIMFVKNANKAYLEKDLDTAERLLQEAFDKFPDEEIKSFLNKVQHEKKQMKIENESIKSCHCKKPSVKENREGAQQFKELAETAMNEGNYERAEHLIKKAFRMDPSKDFQNNLMTIQSKKEKEVKETFQQENVVGEFEIQGEVNILQVSDCKTKAQEYINSALVAIELKTYFTAEMYLLKANHLYKTDVTKNLLENVKKLIKEKIKEEPKRVDIEKKHEFDLEAKKYLRNAERNKSIKSCHCEKSSVKENREEAQQFKELAEIAMNEGDYYRAEQLIKKAFRMDPSKDFQKRLLQEAFDKFPDEEIKSFLNKVQHEKEQMKIENESIKSCHCEKSSVKENREGAQQFKELAEIAMNKGDYYRAEQLIKKAFRMDPYSMTIQLKKENELKETFQQENVDGEFETQGEENITKESDHKTKAQEYINLALDDMKGYNSELNNTLSGKYQRTDEDKKASESYILIAKSAISEELFDKAKHFLLKSLRLYPNDTAKEILEKLDDLNKNYSPTSYNGTSCLLGNRDEAEKCIQIAETEFAAFRMARAERLLRKAERLCPTTRAKDLLRQIEGAIAKGYKDTEEGKPQKPKKSQHENGRQTHNEENERPKRKEPTSEQIDAIRRVKEAKDDFDILGVPKESAPAELKKAFRRMTLLLHPDKNKAPGAKEAFMIVSEALDRLKKKKK